jgi:alanine-synthesizing transaminase
MPIAPIRASEHLRDVRYEIRGPLARRAYELEHTGYDITKLNIGNPGAFGFRMPDTMRRAMIENLEGSDAYCHQQGIFPAREAVVMQAQERGIMDLSTDEVFIGNGVSELIMLAMRGLLNPGDEVLVPSPDYPLWTASVVIQGGKAVHYPCPPEHGFQPDLAALEASITDRTRALVVINPNNPTGAVYSRATLQAMVDLAEKYGLVIFADEIYDSIVFGDAEFIPIATLVKRTLCGSFGGLSKVYRACGLRVGWLSFTGERSHADEYLASIDMLASLRLCSNVPGQWAVQTALGGYQSIKKLVAPGGRLHAARQAWVDGIAASRHLELDAPDGALYGFVRVRLKDQTRFDDNRFAMALLEQKHILVAPGTSFNVPYNDHFRVTFLPQPADIPRLVSEMDELLSEW